MATCPFLEAWCKAAYPKLVLSSMSALRRSKLSTASKCPKKAAQWSNVHITDWLPPDLTETCTVRTSTECCSSSRSASPKAAPRPMYRRAFSKSSQRMFAWKSGCASRLRIVMSKRLKEASANFSRARSMGILRKAGSATRCQIASLSASLLALAACAETFSSASPICWTHAVTSVMSCEERVEPSSSEATEPKEQINSIFFFKSVRRFTSNKHQIREKGFTCSSKIITAPLACMRAALKGPSSGDAPTSSPLRCWLRARKQSQKTVSCGCARSTLLYAESDHLWREVMVSPKGWPQKCETNASTMMPSGFTSSEYEHLCMASGSSAFITRCSGTTALESGSGDVTGTITYLSSAYKFACKAIAFPAAMSARCSSLNSSHLSPIHPLVTKALLSRSSCFKLTPRREYGMALGPRIDIGALARFFSSSARKVGKSMDSRSSIQSLM
mmetsp:Transcript_82843/g.268393  ORF Transcript_82843/g.268393 Transcript_82843/m.268393 type:complete len:445 (+) Transcript_82843:626-1960(+)